jgi:hypothetical protein
MRRNVFPLIVAAAVSLPILSCASTKLTGAWKDPSYTGGPVDTVMVIGIAKEESTRRLFEDTFVAQLEANHVRAVPSYPHLPSGAKSDRAAIEKAVKETGVSAVLITHVVGVEEREQYHPPMQAYAPTNYYWGMYGYYGRAYDYAYDPGYYSRYKVYTLETNLYDGSTAALIWTAQTETFDPQNVASEIDGLVKVLIGDLRSKGLIGTGRT